MLVLGGALGLAATALYLLAMYRMVGDPFSYGYVPDPLLELAFVLREMVGWLLVSCGLFGLHALLSGAPRPWPRGLALAGASLASISAVSSLVVFLYWRLAEGVIYSHVLYYVFFLVMPSCVVLSGVAALWARGLGRWRFLAPLVCLLGTPLLSQYLPLVLLPERTTMATQPTFATQVLLASPQAVADAGWLLLGCVLFGAREREARLLAKERRATEENNLALARRLYAEAWARGNAETLGEIVAPDCEDRYGNGRGPESLGRAVADLRRAFPDLRFGVEEQTPGGDTVTTRWSARGTDMGGVLWYPPTGKRAEFGGLFVDRFVDGRLVEHRGESDTAGLLEQLGLPRKEG